MQHDGIEFSDFRTFDEFLAAAHAKKYTENMGTFFLYDGWGRQFRWHRKVNNVGATVISMVSAGSDGVVGSSDDVKVEIHVDKSGSVTIIRCGDPAI
jgi:hypothetical protein